MAEKNAMAEAERMALMEGMMLFGFVPDEVGFWIGCFGVLGSV